MLLNHGRDVLQLEEFFVFARTALFLLRCLFEAGLSFVLLLDGLSNLLFDAFNCQDVFLLLLGWVNFAFCLLLQLVQDLL